MTDKRDMLIEQGESDSLVRGNNGGYESGWEGYI